MNRLWNHRAWLEYEYWQEVDRKTLKRINKLLKDIERNGVDKGIGKPEPLQYDLSGFWSRRIDDKHRLIYKIEEHGFLYIYSCRGHYE